MSTPSPKVNEKNRGHRPSVRIPTLKSVSVWLTIWNIAVLSAVLVGFAIAVRYTIQAHISARVNQTTSHFAHDIQQGYATDNFPPWMFPHALNAPNGFQHDYGNNHFHGRGGRRGGGYGHGPGGDRGLRRVARLGQTGGNGPSGRSAASGAGGTPGGSGGPSSAGQQGPFGANGPFAGLHPAIVDTAGRPIMPISNPTVWDRSGFAQAAAGVENYRNIIYQKAPVRVYSAPLVRNGVTGGVVQVAMPLADVHHTLTWVNDALKTLIPLVLIAAGLGAALLTYRALRPVRKLALAAERIEAGNLSGRLPTGGGDEFAELAHTFNNMLDRLENAFRSLEQSHEQQVRFVADASHELKTPLTAIKAHTSLALNGDRTTEQYRRTISAIDNAADRMSRIVQDLLILARADAGEYDLVTREAVPLAGVVKEAIETVRHPEVARIEMDKAVAQFCVLGDADALTRLFANILANAVRHTPETGRIDITAKKTGDKVRVEVADNGEGIAPEHLPHLTKRFYRVDNARSRERGGTGLGLAICQTIVEAHHGTLAIESKLDVGTTVIVTLPVTKPAPGQTSSPPSATAAAAAHDAPNMPTSPLGGALPP